MGDIQKASFTEYQPNGGTPLLEAICREVDATGKDLACLPEPARPEKVIFVIMTDGEENASGFGFTIDEVKRRVQWQTDVYKWEFLFLGANIDAFAVGQSFGFSTHSISGYNATQTGYVTTSNLLSSKLTDVRNGTVASATFTKQEQDTLSTTK